MAGILISRVLLIIYLLTAKIIIDKVKLPAISVNLIRL